MYDPIDYGHAQKFETSEDMAVLLKNLIERTKDSTIVDLCSGSGGPTLDVYTQLENIHKIRNVELVLTDLYPKLDARRLESNIKGILTMVGSFHHMKPELGRKILVEAQAKLQSICILKINKKFPMLLWWLFIPLSMILCLFITLLVKPLTGKQILFTYLIPVIPVCFARDAVISTWKNILNGRFR